MRVRVALLLTLLVALGLSGPGRVPQPTRAQEATPAATTPGGWTNFKGDAGRRGVADAGPTGQPVQLWRFQAGGPCNPPPAAVAGVVYASCDDGNLYALDAATGIERWRFTGSGLRDVTVAGDLVYVPDDTVLHAIEVATGQERWHVAVAVTGGAVADGGLVTVGTADGFLLGLDAATGSERWRFQVTTAGAVHNPALGGGIVYAGSDAPGYTAVDATTGKLLWRGDTGADHTATAVVADGIAYIGGSPDSGTGHLYAFDAKTGKLLWRRDEPLFTPAVLDGVGYAGSVAGIVSAFNTTTGKERWRVQLGGVVRPLAVAPGIVYAPSDGDRAIYSLDAATGKQLWKFAVDGGIDGSLAVTGGVAYVSTTFGSIYAIGGTGEGAVPVAAASPESGASAGVGPLSLVWQQDAPILGVFVAPDGTVWVTSPAGYRIYAPDGTYLETWAPDGIAPVDDISWPGAIASDAAGNLYVAAGSMHQVRKYDARRRFVAALGSEGTGDGQFDHMNGVAVDASGNIYVVDEAQNRVQKFAPDGTFLLKFGQFGSDPGQLNAPNGIDLDASGNVYVADFNNARVQKFAPDGTPLAVIGGFGSAPGQFGPVDTVAIDGAGNIYVQSEGAHPLQVFDSTGRFLVAWDGPGAGAAPFASIFGVALDGTGNLYVTDPGTGRLYKFRLPSQLAPATTAPASASPAAQTGPPVQFLWQASAESWDSWVAPDGSLWVLDGNRNRIRILSPDDGHEIGTWQPATPDGVAYGNLAFGPNGEIYIADMATQRIVKFDRDRRFVLAWGGQGAGADQLLATAVVVDRDGNVYVTDANNDVQKFDADGRFLLKWGSTGAGDGQFDGIGSPSIDTDGNIYVADYNNSRVEKFAPNGTFMAAFGHAGTGDGELAAANDVAVDAAGNVYVADQQHHRVVTFDHSGNFTIQWGAFGPDPGRFIHVDGVELDGHGNIYVADPDGRRIEKFRLLPPLGPASGTPTA